MDNTIKKYKIYNIVVISLIIICFLSFYIFSKVLLDSKRTSPSNILSRDINADFFIVNREIYINAEDVKWINELDINKGELIGIINKSNVKEEFKKWNSTKLEKGTEIYELGGNIKEEWGDRILLAKIDEVYIPYFRYATNIKLD